MEKTEKFLERIGLSPNTKPTLSLDFLKTVQYHAVTRIPYENIDILAPKPHDLDPAALYEKIVLRGRGGYCFELNGILSWFLQAVGFTVHEHFARFLRNESQIPMCRHRILAVECEGERWFCDIGIGQSAPRYPVKIVEGLPSTQFGETYKFEKDADLGWVLYDLYGGEWRPFISFTEEKKYAVDFIQPSFYCEVHPDSPFNKMPILSLKTADGRKTINGRAYKVFAGDAVIYKEENISDARLETLIKEEFHLSV